MLKKLIYTSLLAAISFSALSIEQNEIIDLQQKANVGDTSAQLLLGQLMLTKQVNVAGDLTEKGSELILRAARSGNPKAQFMVGVLYEKGVLGQVDLEKAYIAYQDAANNGYVKSLVNMAYIKEQQNDLIEARNLYSQAGEKGDALGYLNLYILEKREGKTKQAEKALIAAAQAGNDTAQYIYASELLKLDTEQPLNDASPAILWLKVAAKHGNTDAMTDLVSLYDRGTFISADHPFIESILNKLHLEGDNNASFTLAKYYINYYKSYSKAWPLLTQAISNDVDGALPYKNLILDSKKVITTEKDIYVASIAQENDLPPVLVKSGARFNVVDELQNGSVFVVEDELSVYGFAEQSLLNAARVNEDIRPMAIPAPVAIETDLIDIKSQSETETSENDPLELQSNIEIDEEVKAQPMDRNIQKVIAVINRPVNFRENAHPQSNVIGSLDAGDEVALIGFDDWGWAQVVHDGTAGFVMSRALDYDD